MVAVFICETRIRALKKLEYLIFPIGIKREILGYKFWMVIWFITDQEIIVFNVYLLEKFVSFWGFLSIEKFSHKGFYFLI